MTPLKRKALIAVTEIAVLMIVHVTLLHLMADRHIVSTILAGGSHVPRTVTWTAAAFVIVRLYAVLLLPGVVLARLVALAWDCRSIHGDTFTIEGPSA